MEFTKTTFSETGDKFAVFGLAPDTVFYAAFPTEAEAREYAEAPDNEERAEYIAVVPITALYRVG